MSIFNRIFKSEAETTEPGALDHIRNQFSFFHTILENNNTALRILSDMEEKSMGEFLFDINYIQKSIGDLKACIEVMVINMINMGGEYYQDLIPRTKSIFTDIENILLNKHFIPEDKYTIRFFNLNTDKINSVGSKNARLGELKNRLGIPVPRGFAITAWAYKEFFNFNNLQEQISNKIKSVDIKNYEDLMQVSNEIRALITGCEVPENISKEIIETFREMKESKTELNVSVRSSALGEDTHLSFAGQYETFLNVKENELIDRYRDVVASKFTPKAIYYFLSHSLEESDFAMSVGCFTMINAKKSGVIYTRDPIHSHENRLLINSIFGLGKYLVDGTINPDVFKVSRKRKKVVEAKVSKKTKRLVLDPEGSTRSEEIPLDEQISTSLNEREIEVLSSFALRIEEHYGKPQDIEWAIDEKGDVYILQTRPLRVMDYEPGGKSYEDLSLKILLRGGTTVCPGAGSGPVYHVNSSHDLSEIPDGVVVFAPNPFPGLITVMSKAKALVTMTGSTASHAATIAREYRIPTIVGMKDIGSLEEGRIVTVDANNLLIYSGEHQSIIEAMKPNFDLFRDDPLFILLEDILQRISPLNLVHPSDEDFMIKNCHTIHDITRFIHQRSIEEMFSSSGLIQRDLSAIRPMETEIPLRIDILFIDKTDKELSGILSVHEDEIDSLPMQAFWNGVRQEGWPSIPKKSNMKGLISVVSKKASQRPETEFSERSFAILSRDFMVLSLKMGYHFSTIEAMCTDDISKNYIKMQFKYGGASRSRRVRRINLLTDILSHFGFQNSSKVDFLDTNASYETKEEILNKLFILGRLSVMTKQLDMTLSNDGITKWYTKEYLKRLSQCIDNNID